MGFLIVDSGLQEIFAAALQGVPFSSVQVNLYVNNHVPAAGDVVGSYTPPTDAAYAAQTIAAVDWVPTFVTGLQTLTSPGKVFNFSTSVETLYGYYVTNGVTGDLLWAQDFTTPFTLPGIAIAITLTLQIQYKNCP
jgi:hypothetical protein